MGLGARAGLVAGVLGAGVLLVVVHGRVPLRRVAPWAFLPLLGSAVAAALVGVVQYLWQPIAPPADLAGLREPPVALRFTVVWCAHIGLYAGGFFGTLLACLLCRRRTSSENLGSLPARTPNERGSLETGGEG